MEEDRRKYERVLLDKEVKLTGGGKKWEVRLIDVSLKGVLLEKPPDWAGTVGDNYELELPLGASSGQDIQMKLEVEHLEGEKVGFSWETIDAESFGHLKNLITYNLGDMRELERELKTLFEEN
ncbi:MAG: PilZ domain-containing protein [bacterium]